MGKLSTVQGDDGDFRAGEGPPGSLLEGPRQMGQSLIAELWVKFVALSTARCTVGTSAVAQLWDDVRRYAADFPDK